MVMLMFEENEEEVLTDLKTPTESCRPCLQQSRKLGLTHFEQDIHIVFLHYFQSHIVFHLSAKYEQVLKNDINIDHVALKY